MKENGKIYDNDNAAGDANSQEPLLRGA